MIYVFLANGFEEIEALAPIDILRRAGLDVKTVGVSGKTVAGSHGIPVECDIEIKDILTEDIEAVILPGGMPGTLNLEKCQDVTKFVESANKNGAIIAAICAAPSILGHIGILEGKNATCFDGFEKELINANVKNEPVIMDGNIITSWGAGAALEFGFKILEAIKGKECAEKLRASMRCV